MPLRPPQSAIHTPTILVHIIFCIILLLTALGIPAQPTVPSVPLDALNKESQPISTPEPTPPPSPTPAPTATPTPGPTNSPSAKLSLNTLRVVRINHFSEVRQTDDGVSNTLDTIEPETRSMRELMELGALYIFTLTPPTGWDVLRITGAELTESIDDQGNPLATWPAPSADVSFDETPAPAIPVIMRTEPPASSAKRMQKLSARVGMLLGKAQPVRVLDLKRQIDRSLLQQVAPDDIVFRITAIDDSSITLNAVGRVDRIGEISFEDADGDPVEPFGRQIQTGGQEEAPSQQIQDWRFQFEYIPPDLNMRVNVYLRINAQTALLELTDVPLP